MDKRELLDPDYFLDRAVAEADPTVDVDEHDDDPSAKYERIRRQSERLDLTADEPPA